MFYAVYADHISNDILAKMIIQLSPNISLALRYFFMDNFQLEIAQ